MIVAGGSGERMGASVPKQFLPLGGRAILLRTLDIFAQAIAGSHIVVVLPANHIGAWQEICNESSCVPAHEIVAGGATRFGSVKNGIEVLPDVDFIAIQDGVRPLASIELIAHTLSVAQECGSAIPVVEPVDSFRLVDADGSVIIDRSTLRAVQTPQVFRADWLFEAYEQQYDHAFTDDASVVERMGKKITLCRGSRENIKITTPLDIVLAEAIIEIRGNEKEI